MPPQRCNRASLGPRVSGQALPTVSTNEKPRTVSRPGLFYSSVRRLRSEVTLSANVERDRVLVLILVNRGGLRSRGRQGRGTGEVLVEAGIHHFGREGQVLDGGPAGDRTNLEYREVGVAAEVSRFGSHTTGAGNVGVAVSRLCGAVITNPRRAAEQAGRPVGIPVVVVGATDTPGFGQMQRAVAASGSRQIDRIGGRTKADALVGAARTAEHREARRGARGGDHVLRVTLGVARVDLDVVAGTGRDVLDVQRTHHRTAPLGLGVARDFGEVVRQTTRQVVVGSVDFMRGSRNLKQTPGL